MLGGQESRALRPTKGKGECGGCVGHESTRVSCNPLPAVLGSLYESAGDLEARLSKARQVLAVVTRGAVHEVMRVQISADFDTSAWVARDMHSQR